MAYRLFDMDKFQWNLNQNTIIVLMGDKLEYVVCKMAAIYLGLRILDKKHNPLLFWQEMDHIDGQEIIKTDHI